MDSTTTQSALSQAAQPFLQNCEKPHNYPISDVRNVSSFPVQNQCSNKLISEGSKNFESNTTQSRSSPDREITINHYCNPNAEYIPINIDITSPANSVQSLVTSEIFRPRSSYRDHLALEFPAKMHAIESMYSTVDNAQRKNYFIRLVNCRSLAMFQRNEETGKVRVTSEHCGLRWCPLCAKARQGRIMNEVSGWFEKVRKPVLLTLTLKHTSAPLKHQVFYLYKDFKKLRNRKLFRKKSQGGIWFFHIKRSKTDGLWHPHLHCLMDSAYIPKKELSALWSKITKGSHVLHLKTVKNPRNSVAHAARYAAEPCDVSAMSPEDGLEVFFAMHGKRLCGTWGTGRTMNLRKPADPEIKIWKNIGDWNEVQSLIDTDPKAKAIMEAYVLNSELDESITLIETVPAKTFEKWKPPPRLFFQNALKFSY